MNWAWIVTICLGATFLVSIPLAIRLDEYKYGAAKITAILVAAMSVILGLVFLLVAANIDSVEYNKETIRLCSARGGVVSQDGRCFIVDPKHKDPVSFSPGVWQR